MPSFTQRSYQKELLDKDDIPFEDIKQNMKELNFINSYLGGHAITIKGVKNLLSGTNSTETIIVEIGCGGGDNLRAIKEWAEKKNFQIRLIGVDINKECIEYAKQQEKNQSIKFIHSDYKDALFDQQPSIIFSSLFCHHFKDEELIQMLTWMNNNASIGCFINDLHRHRIAYYFIKYATRIFSKSYLVKNDAPLSVMRGFTRSELISLLKSAGITNYTCRWKWAFRWLITFCTNAGRRTTI